MIDFDIRQMLPRFLLNDKNGYAMAKSIEAGMKHALKVIKRGVDTIIDVDTMPEWRLDELAWECNCLYDYSAGIETKRRWIRDAIPTYRIYGTPMAIYQYLEGVFDDIEVEEWWQYSAEPYHFRVTVSGEWTDEKEAWAYRAIETAKNVRSIMDSIAIGSRCDILVRGEGMVVAKFYYPMTGPDTLAGTLPQENMVSKTAGGIFVIATDARGHMYAYEVSGTHPEINVITAAGGAIAKATATGMPFRFDYPQANEDDRSGTHPQENMVGAIRDNGIRASPDEQGTRFSYMPCGNRTCGQEEL